MSAAIETFWFEPLRGTHRRAEFTCGREELDKYFRGDPVMQDVGRRTAAAFVLTTDGVEVAGFYTLSSASVLGTDLPEKLAKRLPSRSPIGVTLLGRMAVDVKFQGRNLGNGLVMDAFSRVLRASTIVASWAVAVDAKEGVRDFYLKHGFVALPATPNRLIYPMKTIAQLFSSPS